MNRPQNLIFFILLVTIFGSSWAAPPPLPLAGDLTDQSGQPLNETVTLTFSLSDSANGNELWSEVHDDVSVVRGRFAVLLGVKKDLLNSDGSAMDFTQKKYIKVQITRKDQQEPYTLTPPLEYIPILGAWQAKYADEAKHAIQADKATQAVQAENSTKLESHGWKDIENIDAAIRIIKTDFDSYRLAIDEKILSLEKYKQDTNARIEGKKLNCVTIGNSGQRADCPIGYLLTGCSAGSDRGSFDYENTYCKTHTQTDWTTARCCKIE